MTAAAETIARRVATQKANKIARMRRALGERRKEKGERRKGLRSETAEAVNEMVQVAFEKFGGGATASRSCFAGRIKDEGGRMKAEGHE
jgi:hypothetical protein